MVKGASTSKVLGEGGVVIHGARTVALPPPERISTAKGVALHGGGSEYRIAKGLWWWQFPLGGTPLFLRRKRIQAI